MGKTVDLSMSTRTRQYLVAGFVTAWLVLVALTGVRIGTGGLPTLALPAAAATWIALTTAWVRLLGGDAEGTVWNAVPGRQYGGRLVEAGGLTRGEQEKALGDSSDEN